VGKDQGKEGRPDHKQVSFNIQKKLGKANRGLEKGLYAWVKITVKGMEKIDLGGRRQNDFLGERRKGGVKKKKKKKTEKGISYGSTLPAR